MRFAVILTACAGVFAGAASCTDFGADDPTVPLTEEGGADGSAAEAGDVDGGADGGVIVVDDDSGCDLGKPFGQLALVAGASGADDETGACLFRTNELFYGRSKGGGLYGIFHNESGANEVEIALNGTVRRNPTLSRDGLVLYYQTNSSGSTRIARATRGNPNSLDFVGEGLVGPVGTSISEGSPHVTASGALWFGSQKAGTTTLDLYERTAIDGGHAPPREATELNSPDSDSYPVLSENELRIYFATARTGVGSIGKHDVWTATRGSLTAAWTDIHAVAELNTSENEFPTWLSPDSCRMLVMSDRRTPLKNDIYLTTKPK